MDFLIRLSQTHESFRRPELEALAELQKIELSITDYKKDVGMSDSASSERSPFCIVHLPSHEAARALVSRAILVQSIYELWGMGHDYDELHANVKADTSAKWPHYKTCSFKFLFDTFQGSRAMSEQISLVNSFSYMAFEGRIQMKKPDEVFCVFEEYEEHASRPKRILFGRYVGEGAREDIAKYSLKKRRYLSTTSMDAELALIGSNMVLSRPGSLVYDPFVGTGSLTIACSHHGAVTLGSDMDGRALRGRPENNIRTSYTQYQLQGRFLDSFVSDLTNSPLRLEHFPNHKPVFDGIICDPPYGVREGLKVLGSTKASDKRIRYRPDGQVAHLARDYIPPKRPYSFEALLADILEFAAQVLVVDGRLSFWMPTANDDEKELDVPMHAALELLSVCVQPFNKWSRRLLTYRRRRQEEVEEVHATKWTGEAVGGTADDLNSFRRRYFQGFRVQNDLNAGKRSENW